MEFLNSTGAIEARSIEARSYEAPAYKARYTVAPDTFTRYHTHFNGALCVILKWHDANLASVRTLGNNSHVLDLHRDELVRVPDGQGIGMDETTLQAGVL